MADNEGMRRMVFVCVRCGNRKTVLASKDNKDTMRRREDFCKICKCGTTQRRVS